MIRKPLVVIVVAFASTFVVGAVSEAQVAPNAPDHVLLFDEGAGTSAADSGVVGGENATLSSAGWSASTPFAYAGNMSFNANGARNATVANPSSGSFAGPLTMSMWVSSNNAAGPHYVFDTTNPRELFYFSGANPNGIYWNGSSKGLVGTDPLIANDWTHFAFVSDGTDVDVYQDGVLQGNFVDNGGAVSTLFIGSRQSNNEFWSGQIDEFAMWDSVLSANNILWLSQNSVTAVPEPASIVVWATLGVAGIGYCAWRRKKSRG